MSAIVRLGDSSSHGGSVTSASTDTNCNGRGVARNGDSFQCPRHGPRIIIASGRANCNGRAVAHVGDVTTCGAVLNQGSPDSNVG